MPQRRKGPVGVDASSSIDDADALVNLAIEGDSVHLLRWDARSGTYAYLEPFEPAALRALGLREFVRQRYGGGKFRGRIRHRDGEYGTSRVFTIDGAPKLLEEPPTPAAVAAAASSATPMWLDKILLPIGVTFATALGGYLAKKLLEEKAPDPLMLELVKGLRGRNEPAPAATDTVALFNQLLEFQDKLAERAAGPAVASSDLGGVAGAIERGLTSLVPVMNRKLDIDDRRLQLTNGGASASRSAAAAISSASSSSSDSAAAAADPLAAFFLQIPRAARSVLLSAAQDDERPELYAELVLGKITEEAYDALQLGVPDGAGGRTAPLIDRKDFVNVLIDVVPAYAAHREWFEALAVAMREMLQADADSDDERAEGRGSAARSDDGGDAAAGEGSAA